MVGKCSVKMLPENLMHWSSMSVPQIVLKCNAYEHWYLKCYYVKRDSVDITPTFNRVLHDDICL